MSTRAAVWYEQNVPHTSQTLTSSSGSQLSHSRRATAGRVQFFHLHSVVADADADADTDADTVADPDADADADADDIVGVRFVRQGNRTSMSASI